MVNLYEIRVCLSEDQKQSLKNARNNVEGVTLRLNNLSLTGSDNLMVPKTTKQKLENHRKMNKSFDLKLSKATVMRNNTGWGALSLYAIGAWLDSYNEKLQKNLAKTKAERDQYLKKTKRYSLAYPEELFGFKK